MKLFVQYTERSVDRYHSGEQYGNWHESYDFDVEGVSLTRDEKYSNEEFECLVNVNPGDVVYVLSMTYDTGDSFGNATGRGEVLWVFKDSILAMSAERKWKTENDKKDPEFSIELEVDGGKKIKLSNPAAGYFENLGRVDINAFLVRP